MSWQFRRMQSGFSFIELSIATVIFSMGLGSLSMMMTASIQGTAEARYRTEATTQAVSLAEMIAVNSGAIGHYIHPLDSDRTACNDTYCDSASMAAGNIAFWRDQLSHELPGGSGLVCRDSSPDDGTLADPACDGSGAVVVKIFWEDTRHSEDHDGGQRRVVSRLPW